MLFNSFEFIFAFLPATLVVYVFLNKQRLTTAATVWLVFASLFFYSWWDVRYLALIIGSILFNFGVGTALTKIAKSGREERTKKAVLLAGILGNVLLLGYYKYVDFFIGNINALTGLHLAFQKIILPLGIS